MENKDLDSRLENIEASVLELAEELKKMQALAHARYSKSQQQYQGTAQALNLNQQRDRHAYQSIKSFQSTLDTFRQTLTTYEQAEAQRQALYRSLSDMQSKQTDEIKNEQKNQNRKGVYQAIAIVFLGIAYAFGEFQAEEVIQAVVTLSGLGLWGVVQAVKS